MADLNFPLNPVVGDTYSLGTKLWIWNGNGWALQSGILSTSPFRVVSAEITTSTNSTSTTTGALTVAGGIGVGGSVVSGAGYAIASSTGTIAARISFNPLQNSIDFTFNS